MKTATAISAADKQVQALFDKVQAEKLSIQKAEKPNWKTSGSFGYSPSSAHDRQNIQLETNLSKLVDILAFLTAKRTGFLEAAKTLGVSSKFTWMSFSLKEWREDIQTRVNQLQLQAKKKELADLEQRLDAILSPELKKQMEIAAIQEALSPKKKTVVADEEDDA